MIELKVFCFSIVFVVTVATLASYIDRRLHE